MLPRMADVLDKTEAACWQFVQRAKTQGLAWRQDPGSVWTIR